MKHKYIMKKQLSKAKNIGNIGELLAQRYLIDHGYTLVAVNYAKKWGEIDIIAQKQDCIHFVEVKTVSYETKSALAYAVTHETWRPEELVHARKLRQISKTAELYINEVGKPGSFQIDVLAIRCVPCETFATVLLLENIECPI